MLKSQVVSFVYLGKTGGILRADYQSTKSRVVSGVVRSNKNCQEQYDTQSAVRTRACASLALPCLPYCTILYCTVRTAHVPINLKAQPSPVQSSHTKHTHIPQAAPSKSSPAVPLTLQTRTANAHAHARTHARGQPFPSLFLLFFICTVPAVHNAYPHRDAHHVAWRGARARLVPPALSLPLSLCVCVCVHVRWEIKKWLICALLVKRSEARR